MPYLANSRRPPAILDARLRQGGRFGNDTSQHEPAKLGLVAAQHTAHHQLIAAETHDGYGRTANEE